MNKKIITGLGAIILGGLILTGTFFLPQQNPFANTPSEHSPFKETKTEVNENNFTISDCLKAFSTVEDFEKMTTDLKDEAYIVAEDNNGEPGGWMISPSKSDKLIGGEGKNGVITKPVYANDPKGATVSDIKKALLNRDEQFTKGALTPNKKNNRTIFYMLEKYKNKEEFEAWFSEKQLSKDTRMLKALDGKILIEEKNDTQEKNNNLKKDSNAATVGQILKAFE